MFAHLQKFSAFRVLLVFLVSVNGYAASAEATDWNVAIIDRILAGVTPGETLARVGDMEIQTSLLKRWRDQLAGVPVPHIAFDGTAPLWTSGNVYYAFDASLSLAKQRAFVDAATEWATFANLHFLPRSAQVNYITVVENGSLNGGLSAVGMVGGQQMLQIGPTSWIRPVLCHELGHALGLVHEQQRSDRDLFITVFTNNISPGQEGNFVKLGNSQNLSVYDFLSVMHYARNAFSSNPSTLNTMEPLPAYSQYLNLMGRKFEPVLSASDRAGMAAKYGPGPPITSVVTNTLEGGPGSLRAALYFAIDHAGTTVTFSIPTSDPGFSNNVFNILPTDALPNLVSSTMLDGGTEPTNSNPNGPEILLNGALTLTPSTSPNGLKLTGTNCAVRSLIVNNFPQNGILIDGTAAVSNVVSGCYLGVGPSGTVAAPNGFSPLTISGGASGNIVGGTTAGSRNILSGSSFQGLVIINSGTRNNLVQGNYIGLNASGTSALPNSLPGVAIYNGAESNTIGGLAAGAGNVIAGNLNQGIAISDPGTRANLVLGNYIGLNASGTSALPNSLSGVAIYNGAQSNTIGGLAAGAGNVIAGNLNQGIAISDPGTRANLVLGNYIGLNALGTAAIPNILSGAAIYNGAQSNVIGGTLSSARNIISGNGNQGVLIEDANTLGNVVSGNFIGLGPAGTTAMGNTFEGVSIFNGATFNTVGGDVPGAGNVLSGNGRQGVTISSPGTMNNSVSGNLIGLNAVGTLALPNSRAGVTIYGGAQSNSVGGTSPLSRNVISGNGQQGVSIADPNTSGNWVAGNYIGLNPAGTAAISNAWAGVDLYNGPDSNLIGGAAPGAGNVISGNGDRGIIFTDAGTHNNSVQGNLIGLNATGMNAIPNAFSGIELNGGPSANLIGGGPGARNFISGNGHYGININGGSAGNVIQGNTIGLNALNSAGIPNTHSGIIISDGAQSNLVGGTSFAAANLIASNLEDGVSVFDPTTIGASIRGNSIFGNSFIGIGLYGGANASIMPPTLVSATVTTNTSITGNLTNAANSAFQLDFYSSTSPAQGRTYLGSRTATTGAGGSVAFTATLPTLLPAGRIITATATDASGNTSRMSSGKPVTVTSSVNDGIPDAWRALYFGGSGSTTNGQSCAACDSDGDGMTNLQEFLANTNPTNSASALRLTALAGIGSNDKASFNSSTGTVYRIEARDDLGTGAWSILADQVLGTGAIILVNDPASSLLPKRYYRAEVLW